MLYYHVPIASHVPQRFYGATALHAPVCAHGVHDGRGHGHVHGCDDHGHGAHEPGPVPFESYGDPATATPRDRRIGKA